MHFKDLNLIPILLNAVKDQGYHTPTPIQLEAIPHILEGRDVLGCAKTGSGKTAAFALPILQRLATATLQSRNRPIRALLLTPTRELAAQIASNFEAYGRDLRLRVTTVYGGVSQRPQVAALQAGVDILVACPGRLQDLRNQGYVELSHVEILVLDEADRMLDMGFLPDIKRIVSIIPVKRQTLLFSATMPTEIRHLAGALMRNPQEVSVDPPASIVEEIDQRVCFVEKSDKVELLIRALASPSLRRVLTFTRTKHGADRVVARLTRSGISAAAIHGNKSQGARTTALEGLRTGRVRVLVATDVASRGIDVEGISHVVNFDVPSEPENYVHRIGRTGRAGNAGIALTFCTTEERADLKGIERLIGRRLTPVM